MGASTQTDFRAEEGGLISQEERKKERGRRREGEGGKKKRFTLNYFGSVEVVQPERERARERERLGPPHFPGKEGPPGQKV